MAIVAEKRRIEAEKRKERKSLLNKQTLKQTKYITKFNINLIN